MGLRGAAIGDLLSILLLPFNFSLINKLKIPIKNYLKCLRLYLSRKRHISVLVVLVSNLQQPEKKDCRIILLRNEFVLANDFGVAFPLNLMGCDKNYRGAYGAKAQPSRMTHRFGQMSNNLLYKL